MANGQGPPLTVPTAGAAEAAQPVSTDKIGSRLLVTIPASDPSSSVTSTTVRPAEAGTRRAIRQPATAP
jgi:hypothetical protein